MYQMKPNYAFEKEHSLFNTVCTNNLVQFRLRLIETICLMQRYFSEVFPHEIIRAFFQNF